MAHQLEHRLAGSSATGNGLFVKQIFARGQAHETVDSKSPQSGWIMILDDCTPATVAKAHAKSMVTVQMFRRRTPVWQSQARNAPPLCSKLVIHLPHEENHHQHTDVDHDQLAESGALLGRLLLNLQQHGGLQRLVVNNYVPERYGPPQLLAVLVDYHVMTITRTTDCRSSALLTEIQIGGAAHEESTLDFFAGYKWGDFFRGTLPLRTLHVERCYVKASFFQLLRDALEGRPTDCSAPALEEIYLSDLGPPPLASRADRRDVVPQLLSFLQCCARTSPATFQRLTIRDAPSWSPALLLWCTSSDGTADYHRRSSQSRSSSSRRRPRGLLDVLDQLPELRVLNLEQMELFRDPAAAALVPDFFHTLATRLTNLQELKLCHAQLSRAARPGLIQFLKTASELQILHLDGNDEVFQEEDDEAPQPPDDDIAEWTQFTKAVSKLRNLRELRLPLLSGREDQLASLLECWATSPNAGLELLTVHGEDELDDDEAGRQYPVDHPLHPDHPRRFPVADCWVRWLSRLPQSLRTLYIPLRLASSSPEAWRHLAVAMQQNLFLTRGLDCRVPARQEEEHQAPTQQQHIPHSTLQAVFQRNHLVERIRQHAAWKQHHQEQQQQQESSSELRLGGYVASLTTLTPRLSCSWATLLEGMATTHATVTDATPLFLFLQYNLQDILAECGGGGDSMLSTSSSFFLR